MPPSAVAMYALSLAGPAQFNVDTARVHSCEHSPDAAKNHDVRQITEILVHPA